MRQIVTEFDATTTRFDRAVDRIDRRLDRFNGDVSGRLDRFDRRFDRSMQTVRNFGAALGVTLGADAIAGLGRQAIRVAGDFEAAMNRVRAAGQLGSDETAKLAARARELGASTQFSASEAASAIEVLIKNGVSAQDILNGALDASLNASAALGGDLAGSADLVTDVMLQFGKTAADLPAVVDTLAGAAVNSKFGFDDFRLAIGQAGGVAGQLGVTFEDFAAAISATSSSFASGSDAGTSFKTFLQRLVPESDGAMIAMQSLGLQFFDAEGRIRSLAEIFGELNDATSGLQDDALHVHEFLESLEALADLDIEGKAEALASLREEYGSADRRRFATLLQDVDISSADGFARSLANIRGQFEQLSDRVKISDFKTIFGTDAIRTALAAAREGEQGFADLSTAIQGVDSGEIAAARMEGLNGALRKLNSAWEELLLSVADQGGLAGATEAVAGLTTAVTGLVPYLGDLAGALVAVAGARGVGALTTAVRRNIAARQEALDVAQREAAQASADIDVYRRRADEANASERRIYQAYESTGKGLKRMRGATERAEDAREALARATVTHQEKLQALTVAKNNASVSIRGFGTALRGAAGSLMAFLGGPLGLVALGATILPNFISTSISAAGEIAALETALNGVNTVQTALETATREYESALRRQGEQASATATLEVDASRKKVKALQEELRARLAVAQANLADARAAVSDQDGLQTLGEAARLSRQGLGESVLEGLYDRLTFGLDRAEVATEDLTDEILRRSDAGEDLTEAERALLRATAERAEQLRRVTELEGQVAGLRGASADLPEFSTGGFTGAGATDEPAGVVHRGEFVLNARATARHRALLEALNKGLPGYRTGGLVGGSTVFVPEYGSTGGMQAGGLTGSPAIGISLAALLEYLGVVDDAGSRATESLGRMETQAVRTTRSLVSGFIQAEDRGDFLRQQLLRILDTLLQIAERAITDAVVGGISGGGAGGGILGTVFASLPSLFGFADGGVMGERGPLPLRRYARGGIAHSPQLALFGEGSGAEAFVPLPDGRSIPVRLEMPRLPQMPMAGSGAGVVIHGGDVIVQGDASGSTVAELRRELRESERRLRAEIPAAIARRNRNDPNFLGT